MDWETLFFEISQSWRSAQSSSFVVHDCRRNGAPFTSLRHPGTSAWFSTAAPEEEDVAASPATDPLPADTTEVQPTPTPQQTQSQETGLYRLLDAEQRQILEEQRALVAHVRQLAQQQVGLVVDANNNNNSNTNQASSVLEESAFCIVLAGEFNAGKTTILNALLGERVLETGALPTTDAITILSAQNPISAVCRDTPRAKREVNRKNKSGFSFLKDLLSCLVFIF